MGKGWSDVCLHRPSAADEVLLAVGARGASEFPPETAGEVELVLEAACAGDLRNGVAGFDQKSAGLLKF